ncbi:MAG: LysR family transcriptional regulator [Clostridia bacterium]
MNFINFELYRIFYLVAKSGSITKAAKELYISQPAVSQSIKQLEEQIGGRLFIRTPQGMELTYEGKMIFEYIQQANILIETAEKKFSELKKLAIGEINIGASDTITKHFLLRYVKTFVKNYPQLNLRITNRTSGETINLLKNGKVDIGFVNLPISDEYLEIAECQKLNDIFVCNKEYFSTVNQPLSPQQICSCPLIMLEKLSNSRKVIDEYFKKLGIELAPCMELGSLDLMVDMVKAGLGVASVPREFVERELDSKELYEIPLAFKMPTRALGLVTLKGMPLNFSAKQFVGLILKTKE